MAAEELQMSDLCAKMELHEQTNLTSFGMGKVGKAEEGKSRKVKRPRRVLHFSDGTLEEYSTDEEEEKLVPDPMALVDPKSLTWGPWMYYWMLYSGSSALAACDYVGESLANFLGITSPKYQYEIDEYHRSMEEEKIKKEEEDAEMAGWRSPGQNSVATDDQVVPSSAVQQPPSPSNSLKQNPQETASLSDKVIITETPVPFLTVTSETNDTVVVSDASSEPAPSALSQVSEPAPDSTDWERF